MEARRNPTHQGRTKPTGWLNHVQAILNVIDSFSFELTEQMNGFRENRGKIGCWLPLLRCDNFHPPGQSLEKCSNEIKT